MNVRTASLLGAPGYRLIRWIGASSVASVYAASESATGRTAAIKIFHRVHDNGLSRLEQRLRDNAQLSHPNIVRTLDIGRTADGRLFQAMPLLTGFDRMHHELAGQPRRICALLRELLAGLACAHAKGVVHGDIKPGNVLFDEQGYARLADFGIASAIAGPGRGADMVRYASPEQLRGEAADPRSDLYGIGVLAYELLTRMPWLPGPATGDAAAPSPASATRLPPGAIAWQVWIDRALATSPELRFQTAREMAAPLDGIAAGQAHGHADGHVAAIAQQREAPGWKLPAAALVALILAVAAWATWSRRGVPAPEAEAAPQAAPATAASAGNVPSLPVAQAGPVLSATVDTAPLLAARVEELIAQGDNLRLRGRVFSPPLHNAASHYLAALAFDPGNAAAIAGVDAVLATLRHRLDEVWDHDNRTAEAIDLLNRGDELAGYASAPAQRAWRDYRSHLARQVGNAAVEAAQARDTLKLATLAPLAKTLPAKLPAGSSLAALQRVAIAPEAAPLPATSAPAQATGSVHDRGGPVLVEVAATGATPAFAIARVEVTRADYARFVRATHRPPARCLEAHNPFSRLRHLTWRNPGFAQGGDHPVVCVSWDDAAAYAAWLSRTTGQDYRLPSSSQWLRAARGMPKGSPCKLGNVDDASRPGRLDIDRLSCDDGAAETAPVGHYAASAAGVYDMYGNVSEWLAGGGPGSRPFRGLSWRDGSHESAFGSHGTADSDVGYTSVGFRLVRVIDPAHAAQFAASAQ